MTSIFTIEQTADQIPALSQQAIRWHIFNRKQNGLAESGALIRNGRRIFIDLPKYIEWLKSGGGE